MTANPEPKLEAAAAVVPKLRSATLHAGPFPHLVVEDLLPQPEFQELAAAIPPLEMFRLARNEKKLELDITELGPEFSRLPESMRGRWLRARDAIFRGSVAPVLVERFGDSIRAKYEGLFGALLTDELIAGGFTTSNGRLMGRKQGYELRPHTDSAHMAVTCLLYFCSADIAHGALCLYRPERTPRLKHASTYYADAEEGIAATLVKTITLTPNLFVAFLNGPSSLHGLSVDRNVEKDFTRLVYQNHIILRTFSIDRILSRLDPDQRARWTKTANDY